MNAADSWIIQLRIDGAEDLKNQVGISLRKVRHLNVIFEDGRVLNFRAELYQVREVLERVKP